jgi:hypothetical protein
MATAGIINREIVLALGLALGACSGGGGDIRDQPVPHFTDRETIGRIHNELSGEGGMASEKMLFSEWLSRQASIDVGWEVDPTPNSSASTVREAIAEQREIACPDPRVCETIANMQ